MSRNLLNLLVFFLLGSSLATQADTVKSNALTVSEDCGIRARVLVPANISLNFIHVYEEAFSRTLSEATGCKADLTVAKSLSHLLQLVKTEKYGAMLVPSAFTSHLKKFNYESLLTGPDLRGILVVRRDSLITDLAALKNKHVHIYDPLAHSNVLWRRWLSESGYPESFSEIVYGGTLDSVLWDVLEGKAMAAVTLNDFLINMPEKLKERLFVVKSSELKQVAAFMVHTSLSDTLKQRIKEKMKTSVYYTWTDKKPYATGDALLHQQLKRELKQD